MGFVKSMNIMKTVTTTSPKVTKIPVPKNPGNGGKGSGSKKGTK